MTNNIWKNSVINALVRFTSNNRNNYVRRAEFVEKELKNILNEINAGGRTPSQTLSRVLQELRDEG